MHYKNIEVSLENLEYMFNIINSMKQDIISKIDLDREFYEKEKALNPVSYGFLTTYKKQDGTLFQKRTKNRPIDYSTHDYYYVGEFNSFGHEIISIVEDVQLNLGLNDIDIDKKWYVD